MAKTDNLESLISKFEEVKELVSEVKTGMASGEDCNNQFYNVLQTLDGLVTAVNELSNEKAKPTDEYTILQTNILEVKKELATMNQNIDEVINEDLKELMGKLTEKVNRLEILTNNAGIDQAIIKNMTGEIERNISVTLKDTTETLYSQGIASTDAVRKDISDVNSNLRECVEYLEKSVKAVSVDAVQHLSDDMTILGTTVEKTTDNLRRSIIDIFTRIQENVLANAPSAEQSGTDGSAFDETCEMLKNGIYNLNVKTEQRISKLSKLIEEMEIFTKLENFSKLKDLPAVGDLKHTLNSNISRIVDEYSYTLQTSQDRDELTTVTQQFRKDVYNAIVSMLGNVSEYLVEDTDGNLIPKNEDLDKVSATLKDLTTATELNNSSFDTIQDELKEIKEYLQDYAKKSNAKKLAVEDSINEIKNNVTEIQSRGESLKRQNEDLCDIVRECTKSIIETSEPDRISIKELLADIKKNISILQSGDEESDYTYSMQDIESDVAKIRIYLNELTQNGVSVNSEEFTEELNGVIVMVDSMKQQLNKIDECDISDTLAKLKDDVTSVSTRVNKLLLTSDNSTNMIEASLKEFKVLSEEIDEQLKSVSVASKFKGLEDSIQDVKAALTESNNYNSVINQSLIMLAEWVDNAGETITNIYENQSKLDSLVSIAQGADDVSSSLKEMLDEVRAIPAPIDYSETLNTLESKLLEQNELISNQEERLNKLDEKLTTVLELVAKNDSSVLDSKMSEIDAKMEKLNASIDKLTSFINED